MGLLGATRGYVGGYRAIWGYGGLQGAMELYRAMGGYVGSYRANWWLWG